MALTLLRSFNTDEILGWSPLRFAEETEHWESVEMMLIEGAPVSDLAVTKRKLQESERAARIFGEFCRRRLVRLLNFALQQSPCLVQAELPLNRSPLHEAACSGCPATVRCLVAAGAAVNATDDYGVTPLHEAAAHSNDYTVRILLDAGAVSDAADSGRKTPLHYASRSGSATCIQRLLAKGASVDTVSADGCTALHEAATSPSIQAVRLLLDAGADKHAKSASGWTALHWAASRGRLYAVLTMLEAGVPVDARTVDEETPLHLAATLSSPDVWEALTAAGADEAAVDKNGRTPKERATETSLPTAVGRNTDGTNVSGTSSDQFHVPPGVANGSPLASNDNVCDSQDLSAENSTQLLSRVPLNSAAQQVVTISQEGKGAGVEWVPAVSGQTADNEGRSFHQESNNNVCDSEELTAENFTAALSTLSLNSTKQQTVTDYQENEGTIVEGTSAVFGQRTDSECSSFYDEYSELDTTGSINEMDSGGQTSADETDSGGETASDEETGSDDETESDTDISSANEEIDKLSEGGSVNELPSSILTKNAVLYYEGPPLFPTLGTVGTSSKYSQQGTKFQGKFRGKGRGAPRGSRGRATAYTTRSSASATGKENATDLSLSWGSERGGRSIDEGSRKANFNRSISQQSRGQGDVNCGQPNMFVLRSESFQSHIREQPNMGDDYRKREFQTTEGKKDKKTKHSKSLLQQQGAPKIELKKKKRSDSHHGEGHRGNRHTVGHHSKRRDDTVTHSHQHSKGHHGESHHRHHAESHHSYHGEGHRGNQWGEGYHGNRHGEGHRSNRHGEGRHGNQNGEAHHGNQYGVGPHGNSHYANRHGESRAGKRRGDGRGSNWHYEGRGGNSNGRSRGGKN